MSKQFINLSPGDEVALNNEVDYSIVDKTPESGTVGATVQLEDHAINRVAIVRGTAETWVWNENNEFYGSPEWNGWTWDTPTGFPDGFGQSGSYDEYSTSIAFEKHEAVEQSWTVTSVNGDEITIEYDGKTAIGSGGWFQIQDSPSYSLTEPSYVVGRYESQPAVGDTLTIYESIYYACADYGSVTAQNVVTISLPPVIPDKSRDLLVRLDLSDSSITSVPSITWAKPSGAVWETESGDFPVFEKGKTYLVSITETMANTKFAIAAKPLVAHVPLS